MEFEFNPTTTPTFQGLLEVDDPGNCAIEASNEDGYFYYIIITTSMGDTEIITFGPVIPDVMDVPNKYKLSMQKMEYDQDKVEYAVDSFLNNPRWKINCAKLIDTQDALDQIKDIDAYWNDKFKPAPKEIQNGEQ